MKRLKLFILLVVYLNFKSSFKVYANKGRQDLECEFPPKATEDLRHLRKKRLTTETGVVCLEDYPYTVSIRLHDKHWCGGALVATEWAITAAQCFDYTAVDEVTIRVGSVFRDFGGKLLSAVEIVRHPSYKQRQYYPEHNIALVKMNIKLELNNRIRPVGLAARDTELPAYYGETVVTGYGSVTTGVIREGVNQELRRMIVNEVPKRTCREKYGVDYYLQHDHMCLQGRERGVALCAGDTGNPAVHFTNMNPAGTLYGIAIFSGTEDCENKSKPGIYAKVSYSIPWIVQVITDKKEDGDSEENAVQLEISE